MDRAADIDAPGRPAVRDAQRLARGGSRVNEAGARARLENRIVEGEREFARNQQQPVVPERAANGCGVSAVLAQTVSGGPSESRAGRARAPNVAPVAAGR